MQRIMTEDEWQELEEGIQQLVELCQTLKRANEGLEGELARLREEKAQLQDLLGEAEARLVPILSQLRALEAQS